MDLSQKYLEFVDETTSFLPVSRSGWWIKFSTHKNHNILLIFTSSKTGQTIVRYFTEEQEAVKFINYIIDRDPQMELPKKILGKQ